MKRKGYFNKAYQDKYHREFALAAMQALITKLPPVYAAAHGGTAVAEQVDAVVIGAFNYADAMIREMKRRQA